MLIFSLALFGLGAAVFWGFVALVIWKTYGWPGVIGYGALALLMAGAALAKFT